MKNIQLTKKIFGLITVILLSLYHVNFVRAISTAANSDQGIEISPALVELNAAKGKEYNITLKVMNITSSNLTYTPSVADFEASDDETGSPQITTDNNLPDTISIKTWISEIPQFTLSKRQSKTIIANISIPNDAEPGGHYGVLRFTGRAPELQDNGVGLAASAGLLLLIRVDGKITEKADLAEFYSANIDGKQSSFFENGPIMFVSRIRNVGNIHIKPVGNIEIRNIFGGIVANLPVDAEKSNVLPNSIRRFETNLDKYWMFGRYTANLSLGYGTTGQAIVSTITFWVIPYKLIIIGLFISITLIFILVRLIKVYNRHIIAKSKNEKTIKNKKERKTKGKVKD